MFRVLISAFQTKPIWDKPSYKLPFGVRSGEVKIIWPPMSRHNFESENSSETGTRLHLADASGRIFDAIVPAAGRPHTNSA